MAVAFPVMAIKADRDYLPSDIEYDPSIPTPASVLHANVGEWHVRPDQLVHYMQTLADASPLVSLVETGRTHENRPLLLLQITSAEKQSQLESIQQQHKQTLQSGDKPTADAPLILYMGYSVHGNEPSGANASLLIAYYLAAAQSPDVKTLLDENVVLLDPVLNPDGLARFAQWANMHRGHTLNADSDHREHQEGWPSGRTNHYWFDLNRDWLLLTHPESRARIAQFHAWRPHILTDFHEMGTDSTYFFQPGIPSRKHPLTPQSNVTLTAALADFHAAALDETKQLYFSEEAFDDFYYGKGSTYPDAHGSIGILFEQASSRGHLQESINGELSFSDTIQNQVTTSLSTFKGALANKQAILAYQNQFYDETKRLRSDDKVKGYLIAGSKDHQRVDALLNILDQHEISYSRLKETTSVADQEFARGSVFVPTDQAQYRLIKSLFSTQTSFADNTFYDVSSWNLPLAFDLAFAGVEKGEQRRLKFSDNVNSVSTVTLPSDSYAIAFEWHHYNAPALLTQLLAEGVQARISGAAFTAKVTNGEHDFSAGTVVIPSALEQPHNINDLAMSLAQRYEMPLFAIQSGLTAKGVDLGSRQLMPAKLPKIALVGGRGTSQYEVGEIWHYLDTRMHIPASIIEQWRLDETDLGQYTHIVFASGNYRAMNESTRNAIEEWVKAGGVLIGQKSATEFFAQQQWLQASFIPDSDIDDLFDTGKLAYSDREALRARKLIAGAAFAARVDLTHPLTFGLDDDQLPLFKTNNAVLKPTDVPFIAPFIYTQEPLLSGYADPKLADLIGETPAVIAHRLGRGEIIGFVDNLNFRGYWYGTSKVFANAIYMAEFIEAR
ncbi:peptidase M14 [Alteromonas sp. SM 2104]|nr:peptidase M14 [Alteromonas oceanisediminis]